MAVNEKSCLNCEKSIRCGVWGDWKCLTKVIRIYEPYRTARTCEDYKKDTRKEKPKCRCKDCQSSVGEDIE